LWEGDHQSWSSPSQSTLVEYNKEKKEAKTSISQSWAARPIDHYDMPLLKVLP